MEVMLDTLALELVGQGPDASPQVLSSLIRAVPARSKVECAHFELKREFCPSPRAWTGEWREGTSPLPC